MAFAGSTVLGPTNRLLGACLRMKIGSIAAKGGIMEILARMRATTQGAQAMTQTMFDALMASSLHKAAILQQEVIKRWDVVVEQGTDGTIAMAVIFDNGRVEGPFPQSTRKKIFHSYLPGVRSSSGV